jgi:hypothetical protein
MVLETNTLRRNELKFKGKIDKYDDSLHFFSMIILPFIWTFTLDNVKSEAQPKEGFGTA